MSYYLFTKNIFKPKWPLQAKDTSAIISFSLIHYLEKFREQETDIKTLVNTYAFLYKPICEGIPKISKLNSLQEDFYSLIDIFNTFNLNDSYLNIGFSCKEHYFSQFVTLFLEKSTEPIEEDKKYDLLYLELRENDILDYINQFQELDGSCVIKINTTYHKSIIEIIYILTTLYDQVNIIKPSASFVFNDERFIVCKQFKRQMPDKSVVGENKLPVYFINKMEDANIIIGHNQLEAYEQLISIQKHKNIEDKLETVKKNNIQKCIQWCEKNKIPSNKPIDKLNIFLF